MYQGRKLPLLWRAACPRCKSERGIRGGSRLSTGEMPVHGGNQDLKISGKEDNQVGAAYPPSRLPSEATRHDDAPLVGIEKASDFEGKEKKVS